MAMIDLAEMRRQAKILVVDDSPTNVMLLEMILSSAGYVNAQSVTDPREVRGLYEANHFDLILLDIRMPELDGFQVMELLKEALEDDYLPVLVLTAQTDKETRARAIELGAKDFVTKPFDRSEVLNRIRNLLDVRVLYKIEGRRSRRPPKFRVSGRWRYASALEVRSFTGLKFSRCGACRRCGGIPEDSPRLF